MSRWDTMNGRGYGADDDSEEEGTVSGHKAKPRRKSHQRPQGSDQIRQAFSKRKKGLVLKAFQLNSLTDAKVFMFIVNDKGTSWAYATPGYANSLNQTVLKQLRSLADVPENAKLFTEVIPCPANSKLNTSSRGSSEQTNTQGTAPTTDYVPPSTRTATGSLPARSHSGYSSGSDGQALGPQEIDGTTRNEGSADPTQEPAQFNEQSPTMPPNRPPPGNSMAYGARNAMHGPGPHNGYSGQQFQPQPGGRMEPPTPCGMYNLLEQPDSNQDSPTEIAMSCGGSPSSKLMPPPDAAATVRLLAAQAQAAASAALDQQAAQAGAAAAAAAAVAAGGAGSLELLNTLLRGGDASSSMVGDWASSRQQQQGQDAGPGWAPLTMFQQQQQQQYIQQQMAMQQQQQQMCQQQQMQQRYQSQQGGNFFVPVSGPGRPTSVDIPYTAGGALRYGPLPGQQRPPSPQDAFDAVQRGLAPLRMGKQFAGDLEGSQSAPAGMTNVFGAPSQWIQFAQDAANAVAGNPAGMRASSDAGAYEGQVYSSYAPSPSSCAMQSSGNGSTPAGGVAPGAQNAAQALMMARGCGSLSHSPSPSPTASLAQRMTVLGMNSPAASPMHPSAMGEPRSTQQQGEWGPGSNRGCVPSQDAAAAGSYQQQQAQDNAQRQHNQGAYMPQTDDLVSDPISEMLMEKPLEQLADDRRGNSTADSTHRHISIMEATLHQQQNTEPTAAAAAAGGSRSSQGGGASTPTWQQQQQPQGPPAAPEEMSDLLSLIPPPPKTGNDADKAAWQAQVRHVLSTLKPHQRQELARLSEKQWMTIMAASSAGSASTQDSAPQQDASSSKSCTPSPVLPSSSSAPAPSAALPPASAAQAASYAPNNNGSSFGRGFGGKQRLGPSRLSASSPALDTSSAEDVAAAAAWLGEECPAAANGPPGSTAMQQQQALPAGSNVPGAAASAGFASQGMSCYQAEAAACGQMLPLPQQQQQQGLSAPKPALSNGSGSTPFAAAGVKREGSQEPSAAAAAAGAVPGSLMAELRAADSARCPSPLKRRQPSSGVFSRAAEQCAGSPLKRACVSDPFGGPETQQGQQPRGRQQLPEPPSFATLMQAEGGEDDAIAWATAAASDSLKRAAGSCVSLGVVSGGLTSLDSFPSSFLRLGSLQGGDSMQMLNTLPDVAAADNGSSPQGGKLPGDRAGQAAGAAAAEGGEAGRKE